MTEQGRKKLHDLAAAIKRAQDHVAQVRQVAEIAAVRQHQDKTRMTKLRAEMLQSRRTRMA